MNYEQKYKDALEKVNGLFRGYENVVIHEGNAKGGIMIDLNDACKWLAANVRRYASLEFLSESGYPQGDVEVECLLKAFKQAMKGN